MREIDPQQNTDALKEMYEVLHICLANREDATEKSLSVVQNFSHIVVHLGALGGSSGDAAPLREALIAAERVKLNDVGLKDYELKILLEQIVVPAVEGNCSNPKSKDLEQLMDTIGDLVKQQKLAMSTKDQVMAQSRCVDGHKSVLLSLIHI